MRDGGGGRSVSPVRAVNDAQIHGLQGQDGLNAGNRQVIGGEDGEVDISFLIYIYIYLNTFKHLNNFAELGLVLFKSVWASETILSHSSSAVFTETSLECWSYYLYNYWSNSDCLKLIIC